MKEHYSILEVKETDSLETIKVSYLRLIREYQDVISGLNVEPAAVEKTKKINVAWTWMKKSHIQRAASAPQTPPYQNYRPSYSRYDEPYNPYTQYNKKPDVKYYTDPFQKHYGPDFGRKYNETEQEYIQRLMDIMMQSALDDVFNKYKKEPPPAPSLNLYFTRPSAENYFIEIPQDIVDKNAVIVNVLVNKTVGVVLVPKGTKLPFHKGFKGNKTVHIVNTTQPLLPEVYKNPNEIV